MNNYYYFHVDGQTPPGHDPLSLPLQLWLPIICSTCLRWPFVVLPMTFSVFLLLMTEPDEEGGTNSLSEGCHFLFCASETCFYLPNLLFSFLYLLLCVKYIILLLLLTKKARLFALSLSLSRLQECGNWILHLKVNFHNGIMQISLSLFHPFASIHLSLILLRPDASPHLLWFTLFICRHLFFMLNSPTHVFPLCIVTMPLANLPVCL